MPDVLRWLLPRPSTAKPSPARDDDPENPDNWYGLDYIHDRITVQLQEQSRLWAEVDGGLRLILGSIGVVFAATLGMLPRGSATVTTPAVRAGTVVSAVLGRRVGHRRDRALRPGPDRLLPRTFSSPPAPDSPRKYLTSDEREVKLIAIDEMLDAFAANGVLLERKIQLFSWALGFAAMAAGLLGASVIMEVFQLTRAWS